MIRLHWPNRYNNNTICTLIQMLLKIIITSNIIVKILYHQVLVQDLLIPELERWTFPSLWIICAMSLTHCSSVCMFTYSVCPAWQFAFMGTWSTTQELPVLSQFGNTDLLLKLNLTCSVVLRYQTSTQAFNMHRGYLTKEHSVKCVWDVVTVCEALRKALALKAHILSHYHCWKLVLFQRQNGDAPEILIIHKLAFYNAV